MPAGTVTVREVALAAVTVAMVAPKNTISFDGFVSKFVPDMVTVVPIGPEVGVNEVMVGVPFTTTVVAGEVPGQP